MQTPNTQHAAITNTCVCTRMHTYMYMYTCMCDTVSNYYHYVYTGSSFGHTVQGITCMYTGTATHDRYMYTLHHTRSNRDHVMSTHYNVVWSVHAHCAANVLTLHPEVQCNNYTVRMHDYMVSSTCIGPYFVYWT